MDLLVLGWSAGGSIALYYEMSTWQLASACLIDDDAVNTATDDPIRLDYISPLKLNI